MFKRSAREKLKGGIDLRRIKTGTINSKLALDLDTRVEIKFAEDNNTWIENIVFAI